MITLSTVFEMVMFIKNLLRLMRMTLTQSSKLSFFRKLSGLLCFLYLSFQHRRVSLPDHKNSFICDSSKKVRRRRQKSQVRSSRQGPHLGLGCEVLDKTDGMCLTEMTRY